MKKRQEIGLGWCREISLVNTAVTQEHLSNAVFTVIQFPSFCSSLSFLPSCFSCQQLEIQVKNDDKSLSSFCLLQSLSKSENYWEVKDVKVLNTSILNSMLRVRKKMNKNKELPLRLIFASFSLDFLFLTQKYNFFRTKKLFIPSFDSVILLHFWVFKSLSLSLSCCVRGWTGRKLLEKVCVTSLFSFYFPFLELKRKVAFFQDICQERQERQERQEWQHQTHVIKDKSCEKRMTR